MINNNQKVVNSKHNHNTNKIQQRTIYVFLKHISFSIFQILTIVLLSLTLPTNIEGQSEFPTTGYLNVNSEPPGIDIYIKERCVGKTPITQYPIPTGEYTISIFPSETYRARCSKLNKGSTNKLVANLPDLAELVEGTQEIIIKPDATTSVFFNTTKIYSSPNKVRRTAIYCLGAGSLLAFLLGAIIAH